MKTATFTSKINLAKEDFKFSKLETKAAQEDALKDLRRLLPDQKEIDEKKDLLHFVGPAAVLGLINKNSVGMTPQIGVQIKNTYLNKPINWSHNRDTILGVITGVAFSSYPDHKIISDEEAMASDICHVVISGIIWRVASEGMFTDAFEESDNSEREGFHDLSFSWEIAFSQYAIGKGSLNISKSQILTSDEDIEKYSPYLIVEGGDGFDLEGNDVHMVINDPNAICLGVGATFAPAGRIRGIAVTPNKVLASTEIAAQPIEEEKIVEKDEKSEENAKKVEIIAEIIKKDENNVSQAQKPTVKKIKPMSKITNDEMLFERLTEASIPLAEQKSIEAYLLEKASEGAKVYTEKLEAASNAVETAKQESEAVKQKLTAAETELAELKSQLSVLAEKVEQERKQNVLAARIDALSEKYDLSSASLKKTVVKQIQNLDDESYAAWLGEDEVGGILLSSHPKKETVASVNVDDATKALKETKASTTIPNAQNVEEEKTDISKFVNSLTK